MSDFETPAGKVYKGPSGIARDSVWLTSEDLPAGQEVVVEIESVMVRRNVKFQGGRQKPTVLSLKFRGKERELGLNATNRKTLSMLFGSSECSAWFGKRVALYVETGVRRPDGTVGPAVRIRAKRLEQAPTVDNPMTTDRVEGGDGEEAQP